MTREDVLELLKKINGFYPKWVTNSNTLDSWSQALGGEDYDLCLKKLVQWAKVKTEPPGLPLFVGTVSFKPSACKLRNDIELTQIDDNLWEDNEGRRYAFPGKENDVRDDSGEHKDFVPAPGNLPFSD